MKTDIATVIVTDEYRAIWDEPEGTCKEILLHILQS